MARIRTIKPEFWQSESLAQCSPHARLLAIALLQMADAEGRMRWIPMQVHAHTFPFEEDLDVGALSAELEEIGYLVRYEHAGKKYAFIPGFTEHQRITGKEAQTESKYPPPPDVSRSTKENHPEKQEGNPERFPEKHLDAQEQGTGNREQGIPPNPPPGVDDGFDEFWETYPKRVGKVPARRAWKRLKASERDQAMRDVQARIRGDPQWQRDGGQFVPNPATYLNQRRFDDDWAGAKRNGTTGEPTHWI